MLIEYDPTKHLSRQWLATFDKFLEDSQGIQVLRKFFVVEVFERLEKIIYRLVLLKSCRRCHFPVDNSPELGGWSLLLEVVFSRTKS
ncbi:hypothetical protein A4A49_12722 [Nicotiana attenuata]|uniref:Uncharacterized protein n=1 Tax=Nicotiana attenuata TaxID=49451 RepID=A0A314KNQ5_NICAT|nr:hypothetical protein A4A49_12722 [Nicotiana attenuata]